MAAVPALVILFVMTGSSSSPPARLRRGRDRDGDRHGGSTTIFPILTTVALAASHVELRHAEKGGPGGRGVAGTSA